MKSLDIQNTSYKVADFVSWSRNKTLTIAPDFQRRSVWKADTRSYLMDTIIRGFPTPPIFLRDKGINRSFEPMREVIDGQQRLRTILGFIDPSLIPDYLPEKDDFLVKRVHNEELAGKAFSQLSEDLQRDILEFKFSVYVLSSNVDDRDVIQIFRRMNSTNYTLNAQELRNASFFGEFKTSAYELAAEQLNRWRNWKIFTIDTISRMYEVALTNEFMLMIINGDVKRYSPSAVTKFYKDNDDEFPFRYEVENRFRNVMDNIDDKIKKEVAAAKSRKSLIYGLFAYFYDSLYGLGSNLDKNISPKSLSIDQIAKLKLALERIENGSAPERVIRAVKKSTTDTSARKALLDYLRG